MANAVWTDEEKAALVERYLASDPTSENSMEIVKELSEELGRSANGVRMILSKQKREDGTSVYVTKTPAKTSTTTKTAATGDKAPRVSKEAAQTRLNDAITAVGGTVDSDITSKLTGKAAMYFADILEAAGASSNDEDED